ncbi:DUF4175 domain-containing protein [Gluconacetobacter diazotrophicus]|uniref:TIGR02302 family protein n=2 Tax=Gluconacetobacter diazotrophicus TaxID=33996 RepID=A9HRH9_GLUDA|nr:DUF4175 domain-containing protein [Gluconacetobacter diazotrophicus]MBB2155945.1 DUF4175 domain-containing protein [Gluconacetobacter diazotrophicus]CAP56915.1 conserved hypothetical protein [Gluconacetobacter diazotrophicus PA1 5]
MTGGTAPPQDVADTGAALSSFPVRLAAARYRARQVLWVEGAWPVLLPVLGGLAAYLIAGLLGLPQGLPDLAHAALLLALAGGAAAWIVWRGRRVTAPTPAGVDRRIERASGLAHRPLQTLADHPAGADAAPHDAAARVERVALWDAHLRRTGRAIGRLRAGWPRLSLAAHDPWRVGYVLLPGLLAALLWAGGDAPGRLEAAFWPGLDDPGAPRPHIQAWITPPSYAPGAPVFLDDRTGRATVPQGAVLSISVTDLRGRPSLRVVATGSASGPAVGPDRFRALGAESWSADVPLLASASLTLRGRGRSFSRWTVTVLPDAAPTVAWGAGAGAGRGEWRTRLPYAARQAYGITSLRAELRLAGGEKGGAPRVLTVPIPIDGHPKDVTGIAMPDLSADPWAGEEVVGRLVATSASGHEGVSPEARFHLGARLFRSPMAKAVLDVRRRVATGRERRTAAASDLMALGETPDPFQNDAGLLLNLTSAAALLESPDVDPHAAVDQAVARLWYLALEIEDGRQGGSAAARAALDVRAAQDAVAAQLNRMRALGAQGQSPEEQAELQRRMETLRQAIMRRMQALAQQAVQSHTAIPDLQGLTRNGDQALSRMMQQMQDAARNGRSAEAMQALQRMEDMLEHMRSATPQDLADMARQMQARQQANEQRDALQDLIRRQSGLLDHSQSRLDRVRHAQERAEAARRATQDEMPGQGVDGDLASMPTAELLRRLGLRPPPDMQGPPADEPQPGDAGPAQGPDAPPSGDASAPGAPNPPNEEVRHADRAVQHALGRALDELGQEFKGLTGKDAPSGFADAGGAMKDARAALAQGNDTAAAEAQRKALADLQKGDQQMRQAMKGSGKGGATSFLPGFTSGSGEGGQGEPGGSGDSAQGSDQGSDQGGDQADDQHGDRDPLGRRTGEGKDGLDSDTHVPDTMSRERAREIEQELRRRDSDRTRPREELDYLDRLLKSF